MEHLKDHYYSIYNSNRFFLSVIGLWPYQSAWKACIFRAIITIVTLSYLFAQLSIFFTSDVNMEFVIDTIPVIIPTFSSLYHLYTRVMHTDKLRELLERMWNDCALQKTADEIKIMNEYAEITRLLIFYFTLLVYVLTGMYGIMLCMPEFLDIISPMNESRPRMLYEVKSFDDEDQSFYFLRVHVYIAFLIMPIVFLASMNLFLTVTQHVCAMCKLLGFVGIIDTCYSLPFLLDLMGLVIMMTLTLIQILTISGSTERAIKSIGIGAVQLCYVFIFNNMGQKVTDLTSSVCEKVYNSTWYNADVSEQKSLLLMMQRRLHPLILTACNFYVMSLQNFGMMLQTAISYCMFLRQI